MTLNNSTTTSNKSPTLFMGIDGGGSSCRAKIVSSDGLISGFGKSGRANPAHGLEATIESIVESSQKAIADAGLEASAINSVNVGIGLAGVNLPSLYEKVNNWKHPFKEMFLTTDLHIACLGAHATQNGSIIIIGTGSSGISIFDSEMLTYGAHGLLLGDQCSGGWLGLQAISASLLAHDGLGPDTTLSEKVCAALNIDSGDISDRMSKQPSKEFAKLARFVFEEAKAGDAVATGILNKGVSYINKMAHKIIDKHPGRFSIIGGLRTELLPCLDKNIQNNLSEPIHQPEDGAIFFVQSEVARYENSSSNMQKSCRV
jgi:glucosamine kinase